MNKPQKKQKVVEPKKKPKFGARHIDVEDSKLVEKVYYDPESDVLDAVFKTGTRYRYHDVTPKVFAKFVLAESMGKFFNEKIRNRFDYERVGG